MVLFIRFGFLTQANKLIANIAGRAVSHVRNDFKKEKETKYTQMLKQTIANAVVYLASGFIKPINKEINQSLVIWTSLNELEHTGLVQTCFNESQFGNQNR